MSPAGLKGVAEEAGLELVVVCGHNVGDIFRRNALSLGLHVVQSPEAVADAQDGDALSFDPATRRLTNETRGKTYDPVTLTAKEEEIRRSGGIIALGRRELRGSVERAPRIEWPDRATARGLTTTEQIVWAHRVDKNAEVRPGATLRVYADLLPASDGTAPFAIHTFNQITGGNAIHPRQIAIANDHFVFTGKEADERQTAIGRAFAQLHGIVKPYYATPGDGIFHFYFPEQGLVYPGQFIPGADSHSRAYGAYGAIGMGVGSTTLGFAFFSLGFSRSGAAPGLGPLRYFAAFAYGFGVLVGVGGLLPVFLWGGWFTRLVFRSASGLWFGHWGWLFVGLGGWATPGGLTSTSRWPKQRRVRASHGKAGRAWVGGKDNRARACSKRWGAQPGRRACRSSFVDRRPPASPIAYPQHHRANMMAEGGAMMTASSGPADDGHIIRLVDPRRRA
jgi:hypothetical protein